MLLIPGLVNAHYHSYDVLAKGRFEDIPFDVWALHSQPAYWGKRSKAELRARTLLGAMECLRHGITTIQDMNSLVPQDEETLDIYPGGLCRGRHPRGILDRGSRHRCARHRTFPTGRHAGRGLCDRRRQAWRRAG